MDRLMSIALVLAFAAPGVPAQGPWVYLPRQQYEPWPLTGIGAVGDFDGNGFPDFVVGQFSNTYVVLNHGPDGFGSETLVDPYNQAPVWRYIPADVDGDGDLDLLVLRGSSAAGWMDPRFRNVMLINDGQGNLTDETAQRWPTGAYSTMDVAVVDVNGDSLPDIVEANFWQHRLFLGQPGGTFIDVTGTHMPPSTYGWAVEAGDLDGDGSPDLVFACGDFGRGFDLLYLNDGFGRFQDASSRVAGRRSDRDVAIGDIDGDGDNDLAFATYVTGGQSSQVLRNDGLGFFTVDLTSLAPSPFGSDLHRSVIFTDLDRDGDPDLLFSNNALRWAFENDGLGHFTNITSQIGAPCLPLTVHAADLDADGDVDLPGSGIWCLNLPLSHGSVHLLYSRSRHLSAPAPPRIGQGYVAELDGFPLTFGLVGLSFSRQLVEVPPLGNLQLGAPFHVLPSPVQLDASGHGSLTVPVPPVPGLVGLSFYLQGLVVSDPTRELRFTNAIRETIGP